MNLSSALQLLPVTILYGSLSVLVTLFLAVNISLHRMRHRVFVADALPQELHRKVRAHGNSAEYLAVTVFLLAFLELQHVDTFWLHVCGGIVVVSRVVHSLSMLFKLRVSTISATVTYAVSFFMAFWSLFLRLR